MYQYPTHVRGGRSTLPMMFVGGGWGGGVGGGGGGGGVGGGGGGGVGGGVGGGGGGGGGGGTSTLPPCVLIERVNEKVLEGYMATSKHYLKRENKANRKNKVSLYYNNIKICK